MPPSLLRPSAAPLHLLLLGACASSSPPGREVAPPAPPAIPSGPPAASPDVSPAAASPASPPAPPAATSPEHETPPPGFQPIPARRPGGFPGAPFAEVRGFAFDLEVSGRPVCEAPLDPDGTLCSTVRGSGTTLTGDQVARLRKLLQAPASFGGGASCWLPHHGFVFYDAAGTPIADLSICFLCDLVAARPALPVGRADPAGRVGVTEKGREGLRALCRELGLPKCDARTPEDFRPAR